MTTTSPLTERFVYATLRRLPERQRGDIEKELRASIADAIDDRVESGNDPADAERAVLTELGDPARLAAGYADRPLQLIGPAHYLDYTRLLKALLVTVVPIVAVIFGIVRLLDGGDAGDVVGDAIGSALSTGFHIAFWTTLLFVVIERTPDLRAALTRPWTPDELPELPTRRARYGELIAETVLLALFVAFVLLSPVLRIQTDAEGEAIGILSPRLWETGIVYAFIALAVAGLGFSFAKLYLRWSVPLGVARALVSLASAVVVLWLAASDMVVNPAFAEAAGWSAGVSRWINVGLAITAGIAIAQTVIEFIVGLWTRSWDGPDWGQLARTTADRIARVPHR